MTELQPIIVFHGHHFVRHLGICNPTYVKLLYIMCAVITHNSVKKTKSFINLLTAVSRRSGYTFFVTLYGEPAIRIEHYMQKRAVSRQPAARIERYMQIDTVSRRSGYTHWPSV